jgi:hypothetical protein
MMGLLVVAAVGAAMLVAALWRRPRLALLTWLLSVAMVPHWIGFSAIFFVPVQSAIALLAIVAIGGSMGFKFNAFDAYFAAIIGIAVVVVLLGGGSQQFWIDLILQWVFPYAMARVVVPATGIEFAVKAVAIIFAIVGGLAVIEFLLSWHPYVGWTANSQQYRNWGSIQIRGGLERSEWAFGHSIALGGSLALAIPFVLKSAFGRSTKLLMLILIFAGTALTLSRGAIIAALFTLLLCSLIYGRHSLRAALVITTCLALAVFPDRLREFAYGGTSESQHSAGHRGDLYSTLLPILSPFGRSDDLALTRYLSVDSAFLYVGIYFGWVMAVMLLFPLAVVAIRLISGKASVIEAGLLGHLPLLLTVALITQYQSFLFFVAGFAVQLAVMEKVRPRPDDNATALKTDGTDKSPVAKRSMSKRPARYQRHRREDSLSGLSSR